MPSELVCTQCGNNLDAEYSYAEIKKELYSPDPFAANGRRDDIARFLAVLPIRHHSNMPPQRIGSTPVYPSERLALEAGLAEVWLKDEGLNPSASFKDRASSVVLAAARELGAERVACASTGNAGSSTACLAAGMGMPCSVFVPKTAPDAKIRQLLVYGADVYAVDGSYDQAFDLCLSVSAARGWFNRSTGLNPLTREGKKTVSFELWEQFGGELPEWVAVSVGDGNIISGVWKGFRDLVSLGLISTPPRLLAVQSENSAAIHNAWKALPEQPDWSKVRIAPVSATTRADSISVDAPRDGLAALRAIHESGGAAVTICDEELPKAICTLARLGGVFCEPAAAATWLGVKKAALNAVLTPEERVAMILTGNGLKDPTAAASATGNVISVSPNPIRFPKD